MHALFSKYTANLNGTARGDDEPVDDIVDDDNDDAFFEQ